MAQRNEIAAVYGAGVIQGIALVTFPAASAVLTSPQAYGLSSTEYGGMFIPQAIMGISSSLLGAGLTRRWGKKTIFLLGLLANLLAMSLFVGSKFFMVQHGVAYGMLLLATTCLGGGFGFTVPVLNTFAAGFFPKKVDKAILTLNALLGLGTALAPVFIALFVGLGFWWGLPTMVALLLLGLLLFSAGQLSSAPARASASEKNRGAKFPGRFWVFASLALLYGLCETMNGNWASLYMTQHFQAKATQAALALTIFWGMVTVGRIFFAVVERWLPQRIVCRFLPVVVMGAFILSATLPGTQAVYGLGVFALAGLGCSAMLPLIISFSQEELTTLTGSVAGLIITFYQLGYGLAAFGVGPLQAYGLGLNAIYGGMAIIALAMSLFAFVVTRSQPKS